MQIIQVLFSTQLRPAIVFNNDPSRMIEIIGIQNETFMNQTKYVVTKCCTRPVQIWPTTS